MGIHVILYLIPGNQISIKIFILESYDSEDLNCVALRLVAPDHTMTLKKSEMYSMKRIPDKRATQLSITYLMSRR